MAAVQLNVRLDASLREMGNAALDRIGVTPSQAVRALWEYLAVQGALPPALKVDSRPADRDGATSRRSEVAREGEDIVSGFYRSVGVPEPAGRGVDYNELREAAAAELLERWGMA